MDIRVKQYEIADNKFPKELSGYRIALFSDTHNMPPKYHEELDGLIKSVNPDIVLFAGDAVKKRKSSRDGSGSEYALQLFSCLAPYFPIYYVTGNHDKRWEKLTSQDGRYREFMRAISELGIHTLLDERVSLAPGLYLSGLDLPLKSYLSEKNAPAVSSLRESLGEPDPAAYEILLAHSPVFFDTYKEWGADLSLCGHMHGGVLKLPGGRGLYSPYGTIFPKYAHGHFEDSGKHMIVCTGTCDHRARFEKLNPCELDLITLTHKEDAHGT